MKTSKLSKFSKKHKVKKISTKQTTQISGKGDGTTVVVKDFIVEDDLQV